MISVLFNVVDEFLRELEREKDVAPDTLVDDRRITRGVVRISFEHRRAMMSPYRHLHVIASYVTERRNGSGSWTPAELVELREYAGDVWDSDEGTPGEVSARARERADAIREVLLQTCERLDLEHRGGSYQAVG
jgi:hypothetical protein